MVSRDPVSSVMKCADSDQTDGFDADVCACVKFACPFTLGNVKMKILSSCIMYHVFISKEDIVKNVGTKQH